MQNNLNCADFERRINQLLDDRLNLSADRLLSDHALDCVPCRELLTDYESVVLALPSLVHSIEVDSGSRISHATRPEPRRSASPSITRILTIAAGLLVLASAIWNTSTPDSKSSTKNALAQATPGVSVSPLIVESNKAVPIAASDSANNPHHGNRISAVVAQTTDLGQREKLIHQIVFYQPPTFVEMAQQTPGLVNSVQLPTVGVWDKFSQQLDPLNPYFQYSNELPGVREVQCSVNMTLELLQRSLFNSKQATPDLGWLTDPSQTASI